MYMHSTNTCTKCTHVYAGIQIHVHATDVLLNIGWSLHCITGHETRIHNEAFDGWCLHVVSAKQPLENGNVTHSRMFRIWKR